MFFVNHGNVGSSFLIISLIALCGAVPHGRFDLMVSTCLATMSRAIAFACLVRWHVPAVDTAGPFFLCFLLLAVLICGAMVLHLSGGTR